MSENEGMSEELVTILIFFMLVCSLPCLFVGGLRVYKNKTIQQQKREAARQYMNNPAALEEAMYMIDAQRHWGSK